MADPNVKVDFMYEGILVHGTANVDSALATLREHPVGKTLTLSPYRPPLAGRFRKVPDQWGSWRLHDGTGRGTFEAVAVYGEYDRPSPA